MRPTPPSIPSPRIVAPFLCAILLPWPAPLPAAADPVRFNRDVQPILSEYCYPCHGPDENARKGDLRLDQAEAALSPETKVIVPGDSDRSELIQRILSGDPDEVMPPPKTKRKLSPAQQETLKQWVDLGAEWGRHWAFEPILRPPPPEVRDPTWPRTPIDRFILAKLESEGLSPSPPASKETLIRRVSLDLTGLPPTLSELDDFLRDTSPGAYEAVVDRLLTSPRFGERMAWDWLEAARYADSNGYQGDRERTMWPWRDWVVEAFNSNLPFDQFTVWQLAGDLLPESSSQQRLATGFNRNHPINGEGGRIAEENRVDYVMDMTETCGTVWLGLTLNCCRCHDHKFDAITQRDYYQFSAFFNQTPVDGSGGDPRTKPNLPVATPDQTRRMEALRKEQQAILQTVNRFEDAKFPRAAGVSIKDAPDAKELPNEPLIHLDVIPAKRNANSWRKLTEYWKDHDADYHELLAEALRIIEAVDRLYNDIPHVMVMEDMDQPRKTWILSKGLYDKPTVEVGSGVPSSLPQLPEGAPPNRLGLAQWLVSKDNPLTARVLVNRFWQQFFGIGLVKTPEDLGVQGEKSSHPELHDWLAAEFREGGWNVKQLCKLIAMSATYRQTSRTSPELTERDPLNRLLARGPRLRMPSWMLRDQALAAAGLLSARVGGEPVNPYQPAGVWAEATFGNKRYRQDHGEALYRRSLYTFWRRIVGPTLFFDTASRSTCVVKQLRTNTPLHALTTLNDITYVEAARALAERVLTAAAAEPAERVRLAFRYVLARQPSAAETDLLLAALDRYGAEFRADPNQAAELLSVGESTASPELDPIEHAAHTVLCSAILNLDEALTKE